MTLSILHNGPKSFAGRKVGVLATDGADASLLKALADTLKAEGATMKLIAPEVGGIKASDGTWHAANEKLEGGPSVLFDAVVLLLSEDTISPLLIRPAARDFVADAFAHMKFIAYTESAKPLLQKEGVPEKLDEGLILLTAAGDCDEFVSHCRQLRF